MRFRSGKLAGLITLVILLIVIIIFVKVVFNDAKTEGFIETTATIDSIVYDTSDSSGTVFVTYRVNGKTYQHQRLDVYSTGMYEGKEITILYNPENPHNITGMTGEFRKETKKFFFIFVGIAVLFIIVSVIRTMRRR